MLSRNSWEKLISNHLSMSNKNVSTDIFKLKLVQYALNAPSFMQMPYNIRNVTNSSVCVLNVSCYRIDCSEN